MPLRAFHLLFIALSVTLAAYFAAWAGGQFRVDHQWLYAVTCAGSLVAGAGLAVYGAAFQKKTRHL